MIRVYKINNQQIPHTTYKCRDDNKAGSGRPIPNLYCLVNLNCFLFKILHGTRQAKYGKMGNSHIPHVTNYFLFFYYIKINIL